MRSLNSCTATAIGLIICSLTLINPAFGVVAFESGLDNTLPYSSNDFGFTNVGALGSASGVYLGDRWVLTARHVGPGNITFGDTLFYYEAGSEVSVENPDGYSKLESIYTDLTLFRLTEEPDLPSLTIASEPPSAGSEVVLAGNGAKRQDDITYWNVNMSNWTWTESTTSTPYWGYKTSGTHELTWGTNQVMYSSRGPTKSTCYTSLGCTDMVAIKTSFDLQQENEAQAVGGDSGGGMFYWDGTEESWALAGIISCTSSLFQDPPTQAIVKSSTYSVDLSFYRDEILEIITPEPTPEPVPGDANGDGIVDGSDVTILANHWQQTGNPKTLAGDFNQDGVIDGSDVTILASNWQQGINSQTTATAIPEPGTGALLFCLGGVLALWRWRKSCTGHKRPG